jgi:ABC-type uncharacterized transport system substrate-binding protein
VVKSAAPATPILCALIIDPIKAGLARSLVRPGGTITGTLTTQVEGLMGKQVESVRELMPQATPVGTEAVTRVRRNVDPACLVGSSPSTCYRACP